MTLTPEFGGLVSAGVVECLAWVLVHSLWQFAAVALIAGALLRAFRHGLATRRYNVLVVAMLAICVAPVATWRREAAAWRAEAVIESADHVERSARETAPHSRDAQIADKDTLAKGPARANPVADTLPAPADFGREQADSPVVEPAVSLAERARIVVRPWLSPIVLVWSLGVVLFSLRPLFGWRTLWRLRHVGISPPADHVLESLRRVSERMGLRQAVRVMGSTLAAVPVVIGYFRPMILLPLELAANIPAGQLEAILAHELAHVRRHDFVVNLLQALLETLCFYHPAVWWLSRRLRIEREHCCDDLVVRLFDNRVEYGRALISVEQMRGRKALFALGAADGSLLARVRRIAGLDADRTRSSLSDRWPLAFFSVACLGTVLALSLRQGLAAKEAAEQKAVAAIASLPDGITVELVGVGFHPSKDRAWWKPDGSEMEPPPGREGKFSVMPDSPEQARCREFVIQIRGLPREHSVSTDYGVNAATGSNYSDGLWVGEHGAGPFASDSTSIRVGLTTEPYGPIVAIDAKGQKQPYTGIPEDLKPFYDRVSPLGVEEPEGQVELLVEGPPMGELYRQAAWEIHAVDVDGERHRSTSESVPVSGERHLGFKLARNRLARFEYRLRPYRHRVTFENVSLRPGVNAGLHIKTVSMPGSEVHAPRLADALRVELKRDAVHTARWFFVDLDRGRLAEPPFAVELSLAQMPFPVLHPAEEELNKWLVENGIDLMLFVEPKAFSDGSPRWKEVVTTRAIRTRLDSVNGLLAVPHREGDVWKWNDRATDIVRPFVRKDDATHVSGFAPANASGMDVLPASPDLKAFRTAENVVGFYLLEHNDISQDELTLRIVHAVDVTTPLADVDFGGHFVSGREGAANPPGRAELAAASKKESSPEGVRRGEAGKASIPRASLAEIRARETAAAFQQKVAQVLPTGWSFARDDLAFEFRGPRGQEAKTRAEEARIVFWFTDKFADSTVLNQRDRTLPEIGSWGITRIGQALNTRNEAARELWPRFMEDLYWLLPVDHVAFAGIVDLDAPLDEHESIASAMFHAGTRTDVRIDDEGNRVDYFATDDFRNKVEQFDIARGTDFLVVGTLPDAASATTDRERQRAVRHRAHSERMKQGAREFGIPVISFDDYCAYLRELKNLGRAKQLPEEKNGNRIQIPQVRSVAAAGPTDEARPHPTRPPEGDDENAVGKLELVFFQDQSRRTVPAIVVDAGGETLAITAGPATIVPDGTPPAIDRAYLEVAGKRPIEVVYDPRSTAELFIYRSEEKLTTYRLPAVAPVAVGDSLSSIGLEAGEWQVTPAAATVVALNKPLAFELPGRKVHHTSLIEVDRALPEGTPLFKDGRLAGITFLGTRFGKKLGLYVVPANRIRRSVRRD